MAQSDLWGGGRLLAHHDAELEGVPLCNVVPDAGKTLIGASSNHPGGVNVGFLDGSVKFIRNSVSQMTWWAIATRAGGEVVDSNSY